MEKYEPKQMIIEQLRSNESASSDLATFIKENSGFRRPVKYRRDLPLQVEFYSQSGTLVHSYETSDI